MFNNLPKYPHTPPKHPYKYPLTLPKHPPLKGLVGGLRFSELVLFVRYFLSSFCCFFLRPRLYLWFFPSPNPSQNPGQRSGQKPDKNYGQKPGQQIVQKLYQTLPGKEFEHLERTSPKLLPKSRKWQINKSASCGRASVWGRFTGPKKETREN